MMFADEEDRKDVLAVLRWPEDHDRVTTGDQDLSARRTASALGNDPDKMVAAMLAERQKYADQTPVQTVGGG